MAVEAPEFRVIPRNPRMGPLASARPMKQVLCRLAGLRHLHPGCEGLRPSEATAAGWLT